MKKLFVYILALATAAAYAQTYTHPTTGMQSQNVGACMVSTCSGTYYDNGGSGGSTTTSNVVGNYSNGINGVYRTFCPNAAGNCVRAAFTSFSVEGGAGCPYDYFEIENGADQNSAPLAGACGTGAFGTWTSSSPSGCLTFRFWSDGSINRAGWAATLSCVACAGGPNGTDNNDCARATQVCTNATFNGASTGPGIVAEGCQNGVSTSVNCNLSENETNWYSFQIATSGNLILTITPVNAADDYDFVLYGPGASCGALGSPVRCSYACYGLGCSAPNGTTGINSANDFVQAGANEDVGGDGWTSTLAVTAGQIYYLMVNKWSAGGSGYTLSWSGSTAGFTCGGVLPVELQSFDATFKGKYIDLQWTTQTEVNNDYFTVEKSYDGTNFNAIARVKGAGHSISPRSYSHIDREFSNGMIYYRIRYTDYNGMSKVSDVNAVDINLNEDFFFVHTDAGLEKAQVFFNNPSNCKQAELSLYDARGKLVSFQSYAPGPGTNEYDFDLNGLSPGIYFVVLKKHARVYTGKFIRQ
jgi:hypothetical protein